jgi:endonuclease/exonuclease/phosphatase (EEP) superfamily protein YafD
VRTAVRAGIALVGIATLLGYLDRLSWLFELETFFRLQYAVLLGVLALLALVRLDWIGVVVGTALAFLNIATIAPDWTPAHPGPLVGPQTVRMAFANVDVSNHDHARALEWLRAQHAAVVGITELSPAWKAALAPVLRGYRFRVTAVEDDAYGIGLFSRIPLHGRVVHLPRDGPATVVASFTLDARPVTLVLTHPHTPFGPHAGGLHQQQLRALAAARPGWHARAIVCGDLNTPPWSGPLQALLGRAHLSDSHRGHGLEPSWPTWGWPLGVPIDNCLVSPGLALTERSRGPAIGSDHYPLDVSVIATRLDAA